MSDKLGSWVSEKPLTGDGLLSPAAADQTVNQSLTLVFCGQTAKTKPSGAEHYEVEGASPSWHYTVKRNSDKAAAQGLVCLIC